MLSAKLGRFDLVSFWHRNELNLFWIDLRFGPFITTINFHHIITNVNRLRYRLRHRMQSIPNGYHLFRTDSVHSERMQDIRGVSGESIAFQAHLYSSAVFPVLDGTRH